MRTTDEVATIAKCATRTAREWALKNDVASVGSGRAKIYIWSDFDVERFTKRRTRKKRADKGLTT